MQTKTPPYLLLSSISLSGLSFLTKKYASQQGRTHKLLIRSLQQGNYISITYLCGIVLAIAGWLLLSDPIAMISDILLITGIIWSILCIAYVWTTNTSHEVASSNETHSIPTSAHNLPLFLILIGLRSYNLIATGVICIYILLYYIFKHSLVSKLMHEVNNYYHPVVSESRYFYMCTGAIASLWIAYMRTNSLQHYILVGLGIVVCILFTYNYRRGN